MKHHERGAVAILVAMSLLVLAGIAAIAIDGGLAYNERRTTQNAADNSALAGALEACDNPGEAAVTGAVISAASDNGFSDSSFIEIEYPYDGSDLVVGAVDPARTVRVRILSEVETTFGRTQGVSNMDVVSESVATCSEFDGLGPTALFAKGPTCELDKGGNADITGFSYSAGDMTWNGSGSQSWNGSIHSDGYLTINGGSLDITGSATATNGSNREPPEVSFAPAMDLPYPVEFEAADYAPGSPKADAAESEGEYYEYTSADPPTAGDLGRTGIHYVDGDVNVAGPPQTANITLIATGRIDLKSNHVFTPYIDGLTIMSDFNDGCDIVVDIGGQIAVDGIIFAPNGGIDVHGKSVNGSIIGMAIVTGGSLTVTGNPDFLPAPDPEVLLLE